MKVSLFINADEQCFLTQNEFEVMYQKKFKPLLSFLYAHENIKVFLYLSGPELSFLKQSHGEAVQLLRMLITRDQVELSGGGYYSPVFPILFPVDRVGQIEKMNTILREITGRRAAGISIFSGIWDSSLISSFDTCGFDYIILDSSLSPFPKSTGEPLIVSEMARTLKVLFSYKNLAPKSDENFSSWSERVSKTVKGSGDVLPVIPFTLKSFQEIFCSKTFDDVLSCKDFILPGEFISGCLNFKTAYIPAGMDDTCSSWAKKPFVKSDGKNLKNCTIHDYLNIYPQNRHLYERMVFVSMLISQIHGGDKIRKTSASEMLWKAQCGFCYINSSNGLPAVASLRHKAFECLSQSEKLIRECKDFRQTVTSFDYNADGLNEYVFRMDDLHAVVSRKGANIVELDSFKSFKNYAANLERMEAFDGVSDSFIRGFFTDHFIETQDLQKYIDKKICTSGCFENSVFSEKKFDSKKFDLLLETQAEYSELSLPVSLRKRFTASKSGFTVQYFLKNEGPLAVKGTFIIELNFCAPLEKENMLKGELILKGVKTEIPQSGNYNAAKNVTFLQVKDEKNRLSFSVEPNEPLGFTSSLLTFARPVDENTVSKTSQTFTCAFYWNVELYSGMEVEKYITFNIVGLKKS